MGMVGFTGEKHALCNNTITLFVCVLLIGWLFIAVNPNYNTDRQDCVIKALSVSRALDGGGPIWNGGMTLLWSFYVL